TSSLADATRFSALLLNAVQQLNAKAEASGGRRRRLNVNLTINCGLTVVGDRNYAGSGAAQRSGGAAVAAAAVTTPAASPVATTAAAATAGAKRKADDEHDEAPEAKKITTTAAATTGAQS
ncbi:hypothetical protein LTR28_006992, partial [Elasticomyces elasticus]